jgi:RNA 3'-terminal phosphate cyclase (ATP)
VVCFSYFSGVSNRTSATSSEIVSKNQFSYRRISFRINRLSSDLSFALILVRTFGIPSTMSSSSPAGRKINTPADKAAEVDDKEAATTVVIDGSKGEGGGQILRNAISYANILRKKLTVQRIRAGRSKPGLKAQHVTGLRLACQVSGGQLTGDQLNSLEISYQSTASTAAAAADPSERHLKGDIGTAGSICLLLQAALPCALLSSAGPCRLVLKGGTNATMAPQYDYWEQVFWPTLRDQCRLDPDQVQATVVRRGYFPRGGGEVNIRIEPCRRPLRPIQLTARGDVCEIRIRAFHAGNLPRHLAQEMADAAHKYLVERVTKVPDYHVQVVMERQAVGSGLGILIVAKTTTGCLLAGSALSSPKKAAGRVGIEAAAELYATLQDGGCVDEWLQDQLIIFMALAEGSSEMLTGSLTLHTETAIWIAEEMSGAKFEVTKLSEGKATAPGGYGRGGRIAGQHLICCRQGLGFQPLGSHLSD